MKRLALLGCLGILAVAQQIVPPNEMSIDSRSTWKEGNVRHFSGHVVIKTDAVTIQTEKADLDQDTNVITTYGQSSIKLK